MLTVQVGKQNTKTHENNHKAHINSGKITQHMLEEEGLKLDVALFISTAISEQSPSARLSAWRYFTFFSFNPHKPLWSVFLPQR